MQAGILFSLLVVALAAPHASRAQAGSAIQDVTLCELEQHPKLYDGRTVRVRGHVIFEFENFTLDNSACHSSEIPSTKSDRGIWLTFGGDEPETAIYCCGSHGRKKGKDLELAGHKVGLVRDAEFSRFRHQLDAQRLRRPDGRDCGPECTLYNVTATLTGRFAAATDQAGYGHLGMFHLLAIQQVSQSTPQRTSAPFGGTFACSSEIWEPSGSDAALLTESLECADPKKESCTNAERLGPAAAHWKDDVNGGSMTELYTDTDQALIANWVSSDLLTSYFTKTHADGRVSITREHCQPEKAPTPPTANIACDNYGQELDDGSLREIDALLAKEDYPAMWAATIQGAKKLFTTGNQSWRQREGEIAAWHVLQEQIRLWPITPDPTLQLDKCQDSSVDDTPIFLDCGWHSPDGTQAFGVGLLKERPLKEAPKSEPAPWLVKAVSARVCHSVNE